MSPPNANNTATSLLAGTSGRRAASTAGHITIGLPVEDREKGPNKGDILNGAVSWTRDLMWALQQKYAQEDELAQYITSLGGQWPFAVTEDEKRMRTEVLDAIEKNGVETFSYTRTDGTGLRVPKHTTLS
ncbi:glcd gamma, partial [Lasallia pustulata]